jgi:hypothetical protein
LGKIFIFIREWLFWIYPFQNFPGRVFRLARNLYIILSLVAFCFFHTDPFGDPPSFALNRGIGDSCSSSFFCPGEDLVYEVSWLKIKLGQVRLKTSPSTYLNGKIVHHAVAYIDSYEGLPLVDLHAIDHSDMDSLYYSLGYHATENKGDLWHFESTDYSLEHKMIVIETVLQKERKLSPASPVHRDTIDLNDTLVEDGLSILYFARNNAHRHATMVVPTLVYGKLGKTRFLFSNEKRLEEIEAVKDKKIRVVQFNGKAEFEGIFGLTGDFEGWISDDDARVPIKAELKVLLGSVKIELIEWKRDGWSPPVE